MADAISTAHEHGITHRDLKPANVMVNNGGRVKVLDFGLAKLREEAAAEGPTLPPEEPLTEEGRIVGTVAYMSPEQAEGKPIDHRSDVFSLGILLYEMATGERPFKGDTRVSVISSIVKDTPTSITELNSTLPRHLGRIVRRCLAKEVTQRYQTATDVRNELENLRRELSSGEMESSAVRSVARRRRMVPAWLAGGLAVALIVAIDPFSIWAKEGSGPGLESTWTEQLSAGMYLSGGHDDEARIGGNRPSRTAFVFAPDGTSFVYAATNGEISQIFRRRLVDREAIPIQGTEGGTSPFFSPDGRRVGFHADGALKSVPIEGGQPHVIYEGLETPRGVSWAGEEIVYSTGGRIHVIRESTGTSQTLTELQRDRGERAHAQPQLLEGSVLLYTVLIGGDEPEIWVKPRDGQSRFLTEGAGARYSVETGHLLFGREGDLMAAAFHPETLQMTDPVRVLQDSVMQATNAGNSSLMTGAVQFALSSEGALLYAAGGIYDNPLQDLYWVDALGETEVILFQDRYFEKRLSPSDDRLAMVRGPTGARTLLVYTLNGGATRRPGINGFQHGPQWSSDGKSLAFWSDHRDPPGLFSWVVDGSDEPKQLTKNYVPQQLNDWSSQGTLVFLEEGDIYTLDQDGAGKQRIWGEEEPLLWPTFSPDGKWLVYGSNHSGQIELYARSVDDPEGTEYQVTGREGGTRPVFARDDTNRLFYRSGEDEGRTEMWQVTYDTSRGSFNVSDHEHLFTKRYSGSTPYRDYDVSKDGRFVMSQAFEHAPGKVTDLTVILNWAQHRLAPIK